MAVLTTAQLMHVCNISRSRLQTLQNFAAVTPQEPGGDGRGNCATWPTMAAVGINHVNEMVHLGMHAGLGHRTSRWISSQPEDRIRRAINDATARGYRLIVSLSPDG